MKFIKHIDKTDSGAPVLSPYAYLLRTADIKKWYAPEGDSVLVKKAPDLVYNAVLYRLYTTRNSQKMNFDTVGDHDARGFKQKFTGTHPGMSPGVIEFSKKYLDEGFIIMRPQCDGTTVILGQLCNPLMLTASHESSSAGRKFTFDFEQEIDGEYPYLLATFSIEEDSISIGLQDDFAFALADNSSRPIIFSKNQLLKI